MWVELLQVAGSWSRFCRRPAYWRFLTCVIQLRGRHRVDGVRRPTLIAALNYAASFGDLKRYADSEVKSLLRKTVPVARRALGESHDVTLMMRNVYARSLYLVPDATLDDLRESVETLEETAQIARRVFGSSHPDVVKIEASLRKARAALRAREETQPSGGA